MSPNLRKAAERRIYDDRTVREHVKVEVGDDPPPEARAIFFRRRICSQEALPDDDPMIGRRSCPEPQPVTEADKSGRSAPPSDAQTMAAARARDSGSPIPAPVSEAAQTDSLLRSDRQRRTALRAGEHEPRFVGLMLAHSTMLPLSLLQLLLVPCVADMSQCVLYLLLFDPAKTPHPTTTRERSK